MAKDPKQDPKQDDKDDKDDAPIHTDDDDCEPWDGSR
jgi:hypothetical protein